MRHRAQIWLCPGTKINIFFFFGPFFNTACGLISKQHFKFCLGHLSTCLFSSKERLRALALTSALHILPKRPDSSFKRDLKMRQQDPNKMTNEWHGHSGSSLNFFLGAGSVGSAVLGSAWNSLWTTERLFRELWTPYVIIMRQCFPRGLFWRRTSSRKMNQRLQKAVQRRGYLLSPKPRLFFRSYKKLL